MDSSALAATDSSDSEPWQNLMRTAITDLDELLEYLELDMAQVASLAPIESDFPLRVPRGFAARMRKGDPADPLLRQVLPLAIEGQTVEGFGIDPLGERGASRNGVVRKYAGRALIITTAACPVHCRYCFRRHFPYASQTASRHEWHDAVINLKDATDVSEVILSGGDPLSLSNRRLRDLVHRLEPLEHLTTLRIHSRYPIVLPERVDRDLLTILESTRFDTVVVVHCNHAQEIDQQAARALSDLRRTGTTLLNQSVLLRTVNDDAKVLCALSRRLFATGTLPYYLHELDAVAGAAHFDVPRSRALALIEAMRGELPGYLVPRLVRETPGEIGKTLIA